MKSKVLILFLIIIPVACFSQKRKWNKVTDENTINAYVEFITKYPKSEFVKEAEDSIIASIKTIKAIYIKNSDLDDLLYNPEDDITNNLINEGYQVVTQDGQPYHAVINIDYTENKRNPSVAITNSAAGTVDQTITFYAEIICLIKFNLGSTVEIFSTEINVKSKAVQFQESRKVRESSSLQDKANWDEYFSEAIPFIKSEINKLQFRDIIKSGIEGLKGSYL